MNETRFTPGPWHAWRNTSYWQFDADDVQIGDVCATEVNDSKAFSACAEANAHLIAAAPDLYAALNYLVDQFRQFRENTDGSQFDGYNMLADGRHWGEWDKAFTALAKARGEIA